MIILSDAEEKELISFIENNLITRQGVLLLRFLEQIKMRNHQMEQMEKEREFKEAQDLHDNIKDSEPEAEGPVR